MRAIVVIHRKTKDGEDLHVRYQGLINVDAVQS
jgi:hypothetical protein